MYETTRLTSTLYELLAHLRVVAGRVKLTPRLDEPLLWMKP